MGNRWGATTGPHKSDEWMISCIGQINGQGGVITIDVNIADDGTIYEPHLKQLTAIGAALSIELFRIHLKRAGGRISIEV
jgi:alpha-L-fucosidase